MQECNRKIMSTTRFKKKFHTPKQRKELQNLGKRTGKVIEKTPKCPYCGGKMSIKPYGDITPAPVITGFCRFKNMNNFMDWLEKKGYQKKPGEIGDTRTGGWYNNNWVEYFSKKQDIFGVPELVNIYNDVVDEEKKATLKFTEYMEFIKEDNKKIRVFYSDEVATLIGTKRAKFVIPTNHLEVQNMICVCENYPNCDCYCRVYKNKDEEYELVSMPANKKLRMLRNEAHYYFDLVMKIGVFGNSGELYEYLGSVIVTGFGEELHIGACNEYCCTRIIEECIKILHRNRGKVGKIKAYNDSSVKDSKVLELLKEISR